MSSLYSSLYLMSVLEYLIMVKMRMGGGSGIQGGDKDGLIGGD